MKARTGILLFLWLCLSPKAAAQFYTSSCEPIRVKWMSVESANYRIIYPQGLDSLSRVYASCLESAVGPVSSTVGFSPNQLFKKPLPVVLHAYNSVSNGMVAWTPRRMELNTLPQARALDALPWEDQLAVHESRHAAQLQYTKYRQFRPFYWLTGELAGGGLSALYCGPSFFEGDAVVTETALTRSGRGRNAAFLEYYRACSASGEPWRNYWQWRYGSLDRYTPDYYRAGYLVAAGVRALYDAPDFTARYYSRIFEKGLPIRNFQKTIKETGGKNFKDAFTQICDTLGTVWREEDAARAPFMPSEQVTPASRHHTEYKYLCFKGDTLFALKSAISAPTALVKILPDGKIIPDGSASSLSEGHKSSDGSIWWAENIYDRRWKSISRSAIRFRAPDGSRHTFNAEGFLYNPTPGTDGIIVTRYTPEGAEYLDVLDPSDGSIVKSFKAPDGLQICESAFLEGKIAVSGITSEGAGIFIADEGFRPLLEPSPFVLKELFSRDGTLYFTSDRTGVDELYCIAADGKLRRRTNLQGGGNYFQFDEKGDTLFYCVLTPRGRLVFKTATGDLPDEPACEEHDWPFADALSQGEPLPYERKDVPTSAPKPYSRLKGAFKVHSWLPVFLDLDSVESISYETLYQSCGIGATAFFQSDLSSVYGYAGYHLTSFEGNWRNAAGASLAWNSLPVALQGNFSVGERPSMNYSADLGTGDISYAVSGKNYASATLKAYLPLSSSVDGWTKGFLPVVNLNLTNDRFLMDGSSDSRICKGGVSAKAYVIQSTPSSCVYPKLGFGVEAGYVTRFALSDLISPTGYVSAYGYLPGAGDFHGIRIAARYGWKKDFFTLSEYSSISVPEGFGVTAQSALCHHQRQFNASFDYALPFWSVDWAGLCPWAYVRNFEIHPHAAVGVYSSPAGTVLPRSASTQTLFSAGFDFCAVLGNLLWIPYETRLGVVLRYKGGSAYDPERDGSRIYIGPSLSIDI